MRDHVAWHTIGGEMAYWWVNQNQTYQHEVPGGYMWSPKTKANGARNQYYANMMLVQPGDIVFSYAGTRIRAVGVAVSGAYSSPKPRVFGAAGSNWSQDGWRVDVHYEEVDSPIRPKDFMPQIAPLLPTKYSPLQRNGDGIQSVYLAAVPDELGSLLVQLTRAPKLQIPAVVLDDIAFDDVEQEFISNATLPETEKATMVLARRGQGEFRSRVQLVEKACRVTQVSSSELLIASHIKPWRLSDNQEKLDGNNGLFLSPHVDKLFDKGLISFTRKGKMLVSPQLSPEVLEYWAINPSTNYGRFNADQSYFLEHHNTQEFKAA